MNQKTEFVLAALTTENFRALCKEFGISAKTGYKWKERFLQEGMEGLNELSRKPKQSPKGLGEEVVCRIIRIKKKHVGWGPRKIRAIYAKAHGKAPSESSFKRIFEKAGYTEKRLTRKRETSGRLYTGRKAVHPNEIWTVDFKGWWYGLGGGRCEPLTVRDEYSRFVLELRQLPDAKGSSVRAAFERLFEKHGLPEAIRSDNGAPFANAGSLLGLTRLSAWWLALGIDLERGRPGCPQDNGAHERLHLDMCRDLEKKKLGERQAELDEWKRSFNEERPHEALGMKMPADVYKKSSRSYAGSPTDLRYEKMDTRKVHSTGTIQWAGHYFRLSSALGGWSVGVQAAKSAHLWNVWFGRLLIGQLDAQTASFTSVTAAAAKAAEPTS